MARNKYQFKTRKEAEDAYRKAENESLRFGQALAMMFGGNAGKPYKPRIYNDKFLDGEKFSIALIPSPRGVHEGVVVIGYKSRSLPAWKLVEDFLRECDDEVRALGHEYAAHSRAAAWLRTAWKEAAEERQAAK